MKKITTHSKSGLFLMEMIFVLLFLGLTCGVCVRLFAASYTARQKAREADHIQELVTNAGEILEGTDGTAASFLALMPEGVEDETTAADSTSDHTVESASASTDQETGTKNSIADDNEENSAVNDHVCYYFDKQWQYATSENYVYKMDVTLSRSATCKSAELQFSKISNQGEEESLYTQTIRFPVSGDAKEADS